MIILARAGAPTSRHFGASMHDGIPWAELLLQIRKRDEVSIAEDIASPEVLVAAGLIAPGGQIDEGDRPAAAGSRASIRHVPPATRNKLRLRPEDILAALGALEGARPIGHDVPHPFVPVGLLLRRGLRVPVVWLRAARDNFETLCLGLRAQLRHDALVVLVPKTPQVSIDPRHRILVLEVPAGAQNLGLTRALDRLLPDYRTRAVIDDPMADLDYVRMHFSTDGLRHTIRINGYDFALQSDQNFFRALLLGLGRAYGESDGGIDKALLVDDEKDHALERLRDVFKAFDVPGLSPDERRSLVKSLKRSGLVRLALPRENITFSPSLRRLRCVSHVTTHGRMTPNHVQGFRTAKLLLDNCVKLGLELDGGTSKNR